MRTTITLDDFLADKAKKIAHSKKQTLSELITDALQGFLMKNATKKKKKQFNLVTFKGDGKDAQLDLLAAMRNSELKDDYAYIE